MMRQRVVLFVTCLAAAGFLAGAFVVWNLVPSEWHLPFWTTVEASVNSERYGHAIEHTAENILVWVLFGGVMGALACGAGAATVAKTRVRLP